MSGIILRDAQLHDAPAIGKLWRRLMDHHMKLDEYFEYSEEGAQMFAAFLAVNLKSDMSKVLVALDEGNIIGYCMGIETKRPPVFRKRSIIEITDMFVLESYRGRGTGRRLASLMLEWARNRETDGIEVRASTRNPDAVRFWNSMGARPYLESFVF